MPENLRVSPKLNEPGIGREITASETEWSNTDNCIELMTRDAVHTFMGHPTKGRYRKFTNISILHRLFRLM